MSVTDGPYYTIDDPHWSRQVRKRTANGYESIAWCGAWDGAKTARWIAEQLNRACAQHRETEE